MSDEQKKIRIPKILEENQYITQPETLDIGKKNNSMIIGIPKEITMQENRVALVPSAVGTLIGRGHRVIIESGAGEKSKYLDNAYSEVGADIVPDNREVYKADVIMKVEPPTLTEIAMMHSDQLLISALQLPYISSDYIRRLRQKRVTALALEYIRDNSGTFPIVRMMSEIAGLSAIITGAELLTIAGNGRGVLLGGISGVPSAKVVIIGSGLVAENATRVALGLGADVTIFDNNIYKLKRLQNLIGRPLNTSSLNPFQLEKELLRADIAIGAIHSKSGRTPVIASEDIVRKMKPGSVIIDVSIDQGGCFATSEVTTHKNPTFVKHDVIHYCVPNLASKVPRTASIAASNILIPILLEAGEAGSIEQLLKTNSGLRNGVYTFKGALTNKYLAERFGQNFTNLNLLLPSRR